MYSLTKFRKLLPVALVCFALLPQIQAAPVSGTSGGRWRFRKRQYIGGVPSSVEPHNGFIQHRAGLGITHPLFTTASFSTGTGAGTLALNNGRENAATGAGSLLLNTSGFRNTANGSHTLLYNDIGIYNGAFGAFALFNNTNGF